jgi:hypothetical protein
MMLAMGFELNVSEDYHLIVAVDLFESPAKELNGVVRIAAAPVLPCPCDASRSSAKAFPVRILSYPEQKGPDGLFRFFSRRSTQAAVLVV